MGWKDGEVREVGEVMVEGGGAGGGDKDRGKQGNRERGREGLESRVQDHCQMVEVLP